MKSLSEHIYEKLLLEWIIGKFETNDKKLSIDIDTHVDDRKSRHEKEYIDNNQIKISIYKVRKRLFDDIEI